jgi:NDP-mannose synthase
MSKRAVVLAGGTGTRLRPYTIVLPKPLMPIGEYPILEVIIRQLKNNGFSHVTMAVNHQAEIIQAFFGDGSKWGLTIDYSLEDKALSTMAPLKLIKDLPDNFLVMNGDVLTNMDFNQLYQNHVNNGDVFTVSSYKREVRSEFGVLEIDEDNTLIGFKEKPIVTYEVSMGIYIISKEVLGYIPENEPYGFDDLMINLIRSNMNPVVDKCNGYWLDIGRKSDYELAIKEFDAMKHEFIGKE